MPDISRGDPPRSSKDPELTPARADRAAPRRSRREYAIKSEKLHIIHKLLQAHALYEKDVDYLVQDGQVLIVDEFTGRIMPGRRWSDGLHQAVEAKEGVQVKGETQTLATITIQNYFRMYEKLGGHDRHRRDRGDRVLPDLRARGQRHPDQPADHAATTRPDRIYKTRREKYNAIVDEVERLHELGLPVLIGTVSGGRVGDAVAACSSGAGSSTRC